MEQIRQILSQLALNLELNIAMCDKIEDHDKRIVILEAQQKAQKERVDAQSQRVSELFYACSAKSYDARKKDK